MDDNFFIADKLRGIPLVTSKRTQDDPGTSRTISRRLAPVEAAEDTMSPRQKQKERLLFKPSASTASVIRLRNSPSASTMPTEIASRKLFEPQQPSKSTTTTTPRPRANQPRPWTRQAKTSSEPIRHSFRSQSSRTVGLSSITSTLPTPRLKPTTLIESQVSTIPSDPEVVAVSPPSRAQIDQRELPLKDRMQQQQQEKPKQGSRVGHQIRSTAALEYQSPTPRQGGSAQPLRNPTGARMATQSRFANSGAHGDQAVAGPNWYVFSRPDGRVSLFEFMVLFSNVMIVSTIVLVILYTWFRSIKRRRLDRAKGDAEASLAHELAKGQQAASRKLLDLKQISPSPTVLSGERSQSEASKVINNPSATIGNHQILDPRGLVFDDPQISSAVASKQLQNSSTSNQKATAIVQPSEVLKPAIPMTASANQTNSLIHDKRSTTGSPKPSAQVARPQSARASPAEQASGVKEQMLVTQINGSTPNLLDEVAATSDKKAPIPSSGSLDSIELPENLVQSIKRYDPQPSELIKPKQTAKQIPGEKKNDNTEFNNKKGQDDIDNNDDLIPKPSPNLLLVGSVAKIQEIDTLKATDSKPTVTGNQPKPTSEDHAPKSTGKANESKPLDSAKSVETKSGKERTTSLAKGSEAPKMSKQDDPGVKQQVPNKVDLSSARPGNPIGRDILMEQPEDQSARLDNHEIVVNKLDKRKTKLEIVDIRDDSVTGKLKMDQKSGQASDSVASDPNAKWISMDSVAVTQPSQQPGASKDQTLPPSADKIELPVSPGSLISSRFKVDYKTNNTNQQVLLGKHASLEAKKRNILAKGDSIEEQLKLNDIDHELEQDNKLKNRKYFVYIVHDGHFTAKKECIARLELPPAVGSKRRVTLADLRQLIVASQDISLTSLKRNKFKFVTETYRLLNEDEDAAILHQVYPTQGVFLKINIAESTDTPYSSYAFNRSPRTSRKPSVGAHRSTPQSSRQLDGTDPLPAIEVGDYSGRPLRSKSGVEFGRARRATRNDATKSPSRAISSSGGVRRPSGKLHNRRGVAPRGGAAQPGSAFSSMAFGDVVVESNIERKLTGSKLSSSNRTGAPAPVSNSSKVLTGAKRLFNATFNL